MPERHPFQCVLCEKTYPREYVTGWGQAGTGDGYGPVPTCTEIREDPRTRAGAVCRGAIVARGAVSA